MPTNTHHDKIVNYCRLFFVGALILCAFIFALSDAENSLHRQNIADSAFLYYESWLINEHGAFPYRDIQETSFPGTYLIYSLLGRLGGYSDIDFCMSNLVLLAFFSMLTWGLLYRISKASASISILLFIIYYFSETTLSLQRDYLLLIPIVMALIICLPANNENVRAFLLGALFAFASLIKPHALIGLPAAYWFFVNKPKGRAVTGFLVCPRIAFAAFGVIVIWALCFFFLYINNALEDFIEMSTGYLPLYLHLDGAGEEFEWSMPSIKILLLLLVFPWYEAIPAMIGCLWAFTQTDNPRLKKLIISVFVFIYLYKLYIIIGAKMWFYHWVPAKYFTIIAISFCLVKPRCFSVKNSLIYILVICVFLYGLQSLPIYFFDKVVGISSALENLANTNIYASDRKASSLSEYIVKNVRSDQTVQPRAQGTYGPIFPALLQLKKLPASTQYPLSAMLYRHIDSQLIKRYREKYITDLENSMPDFIVDDRGFDFFNDKDGVSTFKEFDFFIEKNYEKVYESMSIKEPTDSFVIYRKLENNEK